MQTRLRIATAGTSLLLMGGAGLAYAAAASAAPPSPSATVASPTASVAPSSAVASVAPTPAVSGTSTSVPGRIVVPAGNAGVRHGSDGSNLAPALLLAGGVLLVAGGSTVAIRRRS